MKISLTPTDLIDQLRAWFHPKDRSLYIADDLYIYHQGLAWQTACSTFQALPGLVGFWPMSSVQRSTGNAYDLSGQSRTLTYNGNPTYNFTGLAPYIDLDGTGDYLSRNDETDLDILGSETIYAANVRGLTLGGWFWQDVVTANAGFLGKTTAAGNQRSYILYLASPDLPSFLVSTDGAAFAGVAATDAVTANQWYFTAGRFIPSTETKVYVNDRSYAATSSIPASIFNSTAAFQIGAYNAGASLLNGRASLCFLCANALSDAIINTVFQQTRGLFGV